MKRSAILLIFRLLFVFIFFNLAVAEKTPKVLETSETFLWKIEKENLPVSYLLGTIHIGKVDFTLPKHVVAAFSQSELLVTELVLDDEREVQALSSMMFNISGSLSDQFTLDKINKIKKLLEKEIPPAIIDKLNLWAVMMLLSYSIPDGYSVDNGVDMLLQGEAKKQNKVNFGLEKIIDQVSLFTELSNNQVAKFIDLQLEYSHELKEESQKLAELYEENKADVLWGFIMDSAIQGRYFPKDEHEFWYNWFNQKVLINRNHAWMAPLETHLLSRPTFVAVGAAHLFGEEGIIALLEKRGYTVSPVMPHN